MNPRLDPIHGRAEPFWRYHLPWIAALAVLAAALGLAPARDLGLLGCGAGVFALLANATQLRVRRTCHVIHISAGLVAVTLLEGAEAAGAFFPAAGLLLVATLVARAAAGFARPRVAPLAGRVPWEFHPAYRTTALRFGLVGLGAAGVLVAAGPSPELRILGVALVPLGLRAFIGQLVVRPGADRVWIAAVAVEIVALGVAVPHYGATAAAWTAVGGETLLFVGSALVVGRSTGAATYGLPQVAALSGAAILLGTLALPGEPTIWPLAAFLAACACAALVFVARVRS